jgi:hypothetical protein
MHKTTTTIMITLIVLLCLCFILLTITKHQNIGLEKKLDREKLKNEALLSEKLSIEKKLAKTVQKTSSILTTNTSLCAIVQTTEAKFQNLQSENVKLKIQVIKLLKQQARQRSIKKVLEQPTRIDSSANIARPIQNQPHNHVHCITSKNKTLHTHNDLNNITLSVANNPLIKTPTNPSSKYPTKK